MFSGAAGRGLRFTTVVAITLLSGTAFRFATEIAMIFGLPASLCGHTSRGALGASLHYTVTAKDPKMKRVFLAAALLVSTFSFAQSPSATMPPGPGAGRITVASVWQMPSTFLAAAHKACDSASQPPSFADCFINEMSKAGASPAAVAFTRMLQRQSGGDVGIMTGFNAVGRGRCCFHQLPAARQYQLRSGLRQRHSQDHQRRKPEAARSGGHAAEPAVPEHQGTVSQR